MVAKPATLTELLADGFTERMAREYLEILDREAESGMYDPSYLAWAHARGFCAESACCYGLSEENLGDYLSDYDYWRLWPLNAWERIWINDKLTLNALCEGSDLARYVPRYFYYTRPEGGLLPLAGSGYELGMEGLLATLRREGAFACKPSNGTEASGFHRLDWRGGSYLIDGEEVLESGVREFVERNRNYVLTEFIHPEASLAAINPLIHTMRLLVINPTGTRPEPTIGYLRFALEGGGRGSGANYVPPTDAGIGAYNVEIDLTTGEYGNGKLVYANRVVDAPCHPTSGVRAEGRVACWDEVREMLERFSLRVGACEYLGFDACVTDDGPKIMEINSHSGIKYLQLFHPIMREEGLAAYYRTKIEAIDALDEADRAVRNRIVR